MVHIGPYGTVPGLLALAATRSSTLPQTDSNCQVKLPNTGCVKHEAHKDREAVWSKLDLKSELRLFVWENPLPHMIELGGKHSNRSTRAKQIWELIPTSSVHLCPRPCTTCRGRH